MFFVLNLVNSENCGMMDLMFEIIEENHMIIDMANVEIRLTSCSAQSGHQIAWFAYARFAMLVSLFSKC